MPECLGEGPAGPASADGALPSSAELWRAIGNAPDYLVLADLQGIVTWVNRTAPGVPPAQVLGHDLRVLAPNGSRADLEASWDRVLAGSAQETFAAEFPTPSELLELDCRLLPVQRHGKLASILVHARDVTAARRSQRALAASEEKFRALAETSPDAICLFDAAGVIRYANPAAHRTAGYDSASLFGASGWHLIHPEDRELMRQAQTRIHASPGISVEVPRWRLLHQDGRWRWFETTCTNLLGLPSVGAVVATYRDVTARVALEDQLRQAQKMEAIGLLAGGVAHDFNNLLTVILASADNALSLLPADHPGREDLGGIIQASRSATELTQKLLTFSRRQVPVFVPFDLRDVLQSFGTLMQRMVGEDIRVEVDVRESLPVEGDPGQLQQVVLNLVTNARQAMLAGGTLKIQARRCPPSPERPAGHAEIEVSDTGIGMDEATRQRIFEPFFTTRVGGTGLGLPVVLQVVQDHHGSIRVDSAPGHGTQVRVEIPLLPGPAAARRHEKRGATAGSETVLVVEDEARLRELFARSLAAFGYHVLLAATGEEGLQEFERHESRIALVVMDVVLPGLGGKQTLERMKARRPDLRAVLITGYAPDAAGIADMLTPGRIALLQKPFLGAELAAEVRDLIDAE